MELLGSGPAIAEWEVCSVRTVVETISKVVAVETISKVVACAVVLKGAYDVFSCKSGDVFTDANWSDTSVCVWVGPAEVAGLVSSVTLVISVVLAFPSGVGEIFLGSKGTIVSVRVTVVIAGVTLVIVAFIAEGEVVADELWFVSPETLLSIKLRI